jgi:uncharacterized membrane protein YgaE (UPF0421/DUF939 family)
MFNENNTKKILPGMRNIKTAVSIFINLLIFYLLGLENPFYACIASVVCMQPTVGETVKAGKSRLIGTCIAAVVGLVVFYLGESFANPIIYILLIPIGAVVLIHTCVLLKVSSSASIACIIFISILTSHRAAGDNHIYPFTRLAETFIGVIVATTINKYLSADFLKIFKKNKGD